MKAQIKTLDMLVLAVVLLITMLVLADTQVEGLTLTSPISPITPPTPIPTPAGADCPYVASWRTCTIDEPEKNGTCTWSLPVFEGLEHPETLLCEKLPPDSVCQQYWSTDSRYRSLMTCVWPGTETEERVRSAKADPTPTPTPKPPKKDHKGWYDADDLWMGEYWMLTNDDGEYCIPDLASC